MNKSIREAFRDSLSILPGYLVLGIGFGVLLKAKGFNTLFAALMSVFIYAGSMQFVGIDLLSNGANLITAFLMTIMVNIRHLFYGIGMLERYQKIKKHHIYDAFALTDETFSIVSANKDKDDDYYFCLSLFNHIYWISGSIIGSVLGDIIPFNYHGIDFSMTALFMVILISQWEKSDNRLSIILSLIIAVLSLMIFGSESFLIVSMILIVLMLYTLKIRGNNDA